jgi:hypothetical protein
MPEAVVMERTGAKSGPRIGRVILLAVLLASVAALAVTLAGRLKASQWTVKAPAEVDAVALKAALEGRYSGVSFFALDAKAIEAQLAANPLVKRATVTKVFPGSVLVTLLGRRAVLAAICEVGGQSRAALIDGEGVVFRIDSPAGAQDLPVLSGLRFENPAPGVRLPDTLMPLVESVAALQESGSSLLGMVSELRYVSRPGAEGECILYPMGSSVPVRLSQRITEEALKSAALILDVMKKRGLEPQVREIDLRTQAIVYKTKEG